MSRPAPAVSSRRRRPRRPGTALAAVVALALTGLGPTAGSAAGLDLGGTSVTDRAEKPRAADRRDRDRHATDADALHGHEGSDGDEHATGEAAERLAEDRALLMASTWEPDPELLAPSEDDSKATAALRAELADGVEQLREAVRLHERALRRADRAAANLDQARSDLAAAILATAAARREAEKDRAALMALMAETYRNGSAGSLSLVLGGSDPGERSGEEDSGDALFSGLTLLSQMSSSQDDALRKAQQSARRLARAEAEEEEARDQAEQRARRTSAVLDTVERERSDLLAEVQGIQDLVEQSVLRDAVKRRQAEAQAQQQAELAAALEADRSFLSAFVGLSPGQSDELMQAAARLAATSPGGVVFPLPQNGSWFDNDNWGGAGSLWSAGHTGDDFSAACGTPVLAATRGTVSVRTDQGWSGRWLVVVQGDDGVAATWYAHMQDISVADGDRVKAGQRIGSVGTEGNSTGCHLHFEVHPLGGSIYEDNVDPVAFLKLSGAYPSVGERSSAG